MIQVGVYICAFVCNKWPRMTFPPLAFGTLVETIAIAVLSWALYNGHSPTIFGIMAMAGVGMGLKFMVSPLHGIGLFREHRASVIALLGISMPFGGTIGLTIMSAVFNNTSKLNVNDLDFSGLGGDSPEMIAARNAVKV